MADIVNLRQARKRKARRSAEEQAAENRRLHGRTKAEKMRDRDDRHRQDAFLDGHRRVTPEKEEI